MFFRALPSQSWRLMCAALLLLFVGLAACVPSSIHSSTGTPCLTVNPLSRNPIVTQPHCHATTLSRNHIVTQPHCHAEQSSVFAKVTFTPATTFEQAVPILGSAPYPRDCDDRRTPVPPSTDEQRAAFTTLHTLFIEYASWDRLTHIASSPHVISVDGTPLYQCS
jgi:hypothetical protein